MGKGALFARLLILTLDSIDAAVASKDQEGIEALSAALERLAQSRRRWYGEEET